jgi:membrane fusion protein (multidrug efflux system)
LSGFSAGCGGRQEAPRGSGGGQALPVEIQIVQPRLLENKIFTTGTLLANEEVDLRSEISGRVTVVNFAEGREVRKGDLLLKINDRELKALYSQKELEEKLAAQEERRSRQLFEIKGISQEDYDRVLNNLQLIGAEKEEIGAQLAKTEITAPFDGMVGLRYVSEGGYVSPNMLAATIQDVDPIKVEFSVPEKYALLIKTGLPIIAQIGEARADYEGTVYAIESKIDPGTRTIRVRARIPNADRKLMPGAFARVAITLEQIANAVVIPTRAIIPELGGEKVFVCRDGKATSTKVRTGIRTDRDIQIVSGLQPGDTLILTGLLQLTEGRPINPTPVATN